MEWGTALDVMFIKIKYKCKYKNSD